MGSRHAVYDTGLRCTAGRDYMSARAHTERIDTAPVDLGDEGVGGIPDIFHVVRMIHQFIDEGLRVFSADTHGEAFGLEGDTFGG